jgi:hypothetical protein
MSKFTARQDVHISGWECGTEFELTMEVKFTVTRFLPATATDPAENPTVEIDSVRFLDGEDELKLPWSIGDRFMDARGFNEWLMSEANEQSQQAEEDHADHMREMRRENRHA